MPSIPNFVAGYIFDRPHLEDSLSERLARGDLVMGSQQPGIAGAWERLKAQGVRSILLRNCEIPLLGKHRRPFLQRRGTCVSRGFCRGIQTALDFAIIKRGKLYFPAEITFAPIYSLARVEVGKNRCGSGDGAMLCDAAKVVHDFGVATTALFGGLTEDEVELLACKFAAPGQRTPDVWKAAAFGHTAHTFSPETLSLIFDSIASDCPVPYGCGYVTGSPDSRGLSRLGSAGGHCRCFTGVYVDDSGRDQLVSSESWGEFPAGDPQDADQTMDVDQIPCITIHVADDGPVKLAPGDVGVDSRQFWQAIQSGGEVWAVDAPIFLGDSLADLNKAATTA